MGGTGVRHPDCALAVRADIGLPAKTRLNVIFSQGVAGGHDTYTGYQELYFPGRLHALEPHPDRRHVSVPGKPRV